MERDYVSLAYPPMLTVELGSYVDGEAHGWARKPYGCFGPAPRPRDIMHTYIYGRRPRLAKHSVSRVATVTVNPVDSLGSVNGLTLYCQWTVRVNVTVHITLRTCVRPGATENFVTENDETDGL